MYYNLLIYNNLVSVFLPSAAKGFVQRHKILQAREFHIHQGLLSTV
jgi:hypothetical protein